MTKKLVVGCMLLAVAAPAYAFDFAALINPFRTPVDVWVEQIEDARARSELDLAQTLLSEAQKSFARQPAALILQHGLLLRDRGRLEGALPLLSQAASMEPTSVARVEQATVLVTLGRWPEAIEVLSHAFAERGSNLSADSVVADARFAPLVDFAPYKELIHRVRAEQSGPFGRLLLKFEQIEGAARNAEAVMNRLSSWMSMAGRVATYGGSTMVALLAMGIFFAFGVSQLGLLRPPWPLALGMTISASLWHLGARIATLDKSWGLSTIVPALGMVLGFYLAVAWAKVLWRRRQLRRMAPESIEALVQNSEEIVMLGKAVLAAPESERATLKKDLLHKLGGSR